MNPDQIFDPQNFDKVKWVLFKSLSFGIIFKAANNN